jgi:hypothetical protein
MSRFYIVTAAACAAIALGTPVAQAQFDVAVKSTASLKSSSQSTLAAMRAAGTKYHATAAQSSVRPDDRSGRRGI